MNDETQSGQDGHQRQENALPASISEPIGAVQEEPEAERKIEQVEREMSASERSTLRWTIVIVAVNVLTCLFIGLQWYEIRASSSDTHTLAQAANTQAQKMGDMSTAANKISQAARDMVTQEQRIADETQKSLDASNAQSQKVLDTSIAAAHLEQRAWIAAMSVVMDKIEAGKPVNGYVLWLNSGKTFAKEVKPTCHYFFSPQVINSGKELDAIPAAPVGQGSVGVITPGEPYKTSLIGRQPISAIQKDSIESQSWYTYIWGDVTYTDIFGKNHETTFCDVRQGISGDFVQCSFHNDAN